VHAQAVAEPANHSHHEHRMGLTDPAEVVQASGPGQGVGKFT
jgi:hypothetical protein